jgi:hypothetical protein
LKGSSSEGQEKGKKGQEKENMNGRSEEGQEKDNRRARERSGKGNMKRR